MNVYGYKLMCKNKHNQKYLNKKYNSIAMKNKKNCPLFDYLARFLWFFNRDARRVQFDLKNPRN